MADGGGTGRTQCSEAQQTRRTPRSMCQGGPTEPCDREREMKHITWFRALSPAPPGGWTPSRTQRGAHATQMGVSGLLGVVFMCNDRERASVSTSTKISLTPLGRATFGLWTEPTPHHRAARSQRACRAHGGEDAMGDIKVVHREAGLRGVANAPRVWSGNCLTLFGSRHPDRRHPQRKAEGRQACLCLMCANGG